MPTPSIVIVGAGMAGLVSALQAQRLGARVTLLEKGPAPGGSLALSGGTLWCARSYDDLRRLVPRGDPDLGRVLVDNFAAGVQWLQGEGATLTPLPSLPDRHVYWLEPGPRVFVAHMADRFQAAGGSLVVNAAGIDLCLSSGGCVAGLRARVGGTVQSYDADAVVLATGGFQANPEMRARYFGPWSDRLVLRSNPHSTGDGFHMATAVGALPSMAMGSFYGHLMPGAPASVPTDDFIAYTQYHSEQGVLLNAHGERFTDESLGDETNNQAVLRQPEAYAILVYDDAVYRAFAVRPAGGGARASDTFHEAKALGAPAVTADTLAGLAAEMRAWGVHAPTALRTLEEYHAAVREGRADRLPMPRRGKANPLTTPPFYALGVAPAITFTLGGLRINADAQVLARDGQPVQGLYAVGADAGGIHNEQYAGGLCLGLVFGRRAVLHAARGER